VLREVTNRLRGKHLGASLGNRDRIHDGDQRVLREHLDLQRVQEDDAFDLCVAPELRRARLLRAGKGGDAMRSIWSCPGLSTHFMKSSIPSSEFAYCLIWYARRGSAA
jgi:hypothetical protein